MVSPPLLVPAPKLSTGAHREESTSAKRLSGPWDLQVFVSPEWEPSDPRQDPIAFSYGIARAKLYIESRLGNNALVELAVPAWQVQDGYIRHHERDSPLPDGQVVYLPDAKLPRAVVAIPAWVAAPDESGVYHQVDAGVSAGEGPVFLHKNRLPGRKVGRRPSSPAKLSPIWVAVLPAPRP